LVLDLHRLHSFAAEHSISVTLVGSKAKPIGQLITSAACDIDRNILVAMTVTFVVSGTGFRKSGTGARVPVAQ
jgi:hypothetical protein